MIRWVAACGGVSALLIKKALARVKKALTFLFSLSLFRENMRLGTADIKITSVS